MGMRLPPRRCPSDPPGLLHCRNSVRFRDHRPIDARLRHPHQRPRLASPREQATVGSQHAACPCAQRPKLPHLVLPFLWLLNAGYKSIPCRSTIFCTSKLALISKVPAPLTNLSSFSSVETIAWPEALFFGK